MGLNSVKTPGLVVLCLMAGSCNQENAEEPAAPDASGSDRCETAVREVITLELTGPDREVTRMKRDIENLIADFEEETGGRVDYPAYPHDDPEWEVFFAYVDETYAPYFTENGYEEFTQIETFTAFKFHQQNLEYRMVPRNIYVNKVEIEDANQEFNAFSFTAQVDYTTRREGDTFDFAGWAFCSPEGKISHLTIIDQDELSERIEEDS